MIIYDSRDFSAFLGGIVGGLLGMLLWKLLQAIWHVWRAGLREMGKQAAIRDTEREKREAAR